ncbi:uncharacterized protein LOC117173769 [Belonocnema kinseyi]|uniref:uncharacterized protein LOC117173769 n=1 Tax=Belonocnema kinseyi TaxID=2817044 RepID=UPI00143D5FF0|nr:uncharacterized protein LOC117173769 [Belonocnema kinseyi]
MKPVIQVLRSQGFLSVIYLDDILLIAKSEQFCRLIVAKTRTLLESLGFVLNLEKSNFMPSQQCRFLGLDFNSKNFTVELPRERRDNILKLAKRFGSKSRCRIRDFAQCIGVLVSACQGVKYGWLYTKIVESHKYLALLKTKGNFDGLMEISKHVKTELEWWSENILSVNNPIRFSIYQLEIFSDASLSGWGAFCNGEKTHGWWNTEKQKEFINLLELRAAFNGLRCFAENHRSCQILLRIDNTTAISYINRMGGVQSIKLNSLARLIWQWCEKRNLWIFASYIKSKDNSITDSDSRILPPETEWEMNQGIFVSIQKKFGRFDIDLFATNINKNFQKFISWFKDPESMAVDAFIVSWSTFFFYAFPPFSLILKVLRKISEDRAEGVLVVPLWPTQAWYPLFLELLVDKPLQFGPQIDLLTCPFWKVHPLANNLILVVGSLSGKDFEEAEFQMPLYH